MVEIERTSARLVSTVILLCLLGSFTAGVAVAGPVDTDGAAAPALEQENETGITRTSLSGPGIATRQNDTLYVWQNDTITVEVTMVPLEKQGDHELCLDVLDDTGSSTGSQRCRTVDVRETGTRANFDIDRISKNGTGPHTIELTLEDLGANQTTRLPVFVLTRDGDVDSDSLNNSQEVEHGTGIQDSDTDSDGLLDGLELTKYGSDPTRPDTDADGLRDGREIDVDTEPRNPDTDGDGLTDGEEVNEYGTDPKKKDTDGDGLNDAREVELGTDPTKKDSDTDGLNDSREVELGTDPTSPDTDNDGLDDGAEVEQGSNPLTPASETSPLGTPWSLSSRNVMVVVAAGTLLVGVAVVAGYIRQQEDEPPEPPAPPDPVDGAVPDESVDTDLMSPEQHVLHLLEMNDGRMKQSSFVEETGWSKAKVSRKLSRLEESGEIKRVRIGRENVVTYPDRDLGNET